MVSLGFMSQMWYSNPYLKVSNSISIDTLQGASTLTYRTNCCTRDNQELRSVNLVHFCGPKKSPRSFLTIAIAMKPRLKH